MSRFDEEPDGDIHGECANEIHRLEAENETLKLRIAELEEDKSKKERWIKKLLDEGLDEIAEHNALKLRVAELDKTIGQVIEDTAKELDCEPDNEAILIAARDLKLRVAELEYLEHNVIVMTGISERVAAERDKLQSECDQLKKRLSVWNAK